MMGATSTWVAISLVLFSIGLFGLLLRRNLVVMLIAIELMLNAAMINVVAFGRITSGQEATSWVMALFVMGVAAAEAAVGLSLILAVFSHTDDVDAERVAELGG